MGDGGRLWDVMKNGLYSIHVTLLDGRDGKGSGVILFRDGQILGGDAYLFYTGSYTVKDNTFKGEVLVQRHTTPRGDANPLFGGPAPVGIGVVRTSVVPAPVIRAPRRSLDRSRLLDRAVPRPSGPQIGRAHV